MLDTVKLKAATYAAGYTQGSLAEEIGLHQSSYSERLRNGNFRRAEIEAIMRILRIENPAEIFFAGEQPIKEPA